MLPVPVQGEAARGADRRDAAARGALGPLRRDPAGARRRLARRPVGLQRRAPGARDRRDRRCRWCPRSATRPTSASPISPPTCARRRRRSPPNCWCPSRDDLARRLQRLRRARCATCRRSACASAMQRADRAALRLQCAAAAGAAGRCCAGARPKRCAACDAAWRTQLERERARLRHADAVLRAIAAATPLALLRERLDALRAAPAGRDRAAPAARRAAPARAGAFAGSGEPAGHRGARLRDPAARRRPRRAQRAGCRAGRPPRRAPGRRHAAGAGDRARNDSQTARISVATGHGEGTRMLAKTLPLLPRQRSRSPANTGPGRARQVHRQARDARGASPMPRGAQGDRRRAQGARGDGGVPAGCAPRRARTLRAPLQRTLRGTRAGAVHRSRQADPRCARRSHAPDRHLPHRRRRSHAHRRRSARTADLATHARLPRHGQARADRRVRFITPFNFPLNLVAHKVAPAIAAGCPFVLKPAAKTPIGALIIGEVLAETDLPQGAFSVLPCSNEDAALLVEDERIALLSFTGGLVGWDLKARAGRKKVTLELGGNAACIVDADPGAIARPRRRTAGVRRVLPDPARAASACSASIAHARHLRQAAQEARRPRSPSCAWAIRATRRVFIGPMIDEDAAKRVESWIAAAIARRREGAGRRQAQGQPCCRPRCWKTCRTTATCIARKPSARSRCIEPFDDFDDAHRPGQRQRLRPAGGRVHRHRSRTRCAPGIGSKSAA